MPNSANSARYQAISENAFTATVIELALWYGWLVHHSRPAQDRRGRWKTPIQGNAGLPDLICLRQSRAIMAELKAVKGTVTPEQSEWLKRARNAGFEVYVWRPSDIESIERILA